MTGYSMRLLRDDNPSIVRLRYDILIDENQALFSPGDWEEGDQEALICATGLLVWRDICGWLTGRPLELNEAQIRVPLQAAGAYSTSIKGVWLSAWPGCR
ncbi:MAG: hypothetical protein ACR2P1_07430 [Pseudomonadales bacterium]